MVAYSFRHIATKSRAINYHNTPPYSHHHYYSTATTTFSRRGPPRLVVVSSRLSLPQVINNNIGGHRRRTLITSSSSQLLVGQKYHRPKILHHSHKNGSGMANPRLQQVRSISFTTIPRFLYHAMRIPVAGVTAGAAGLTYANYKIGDLANKSQNWLNSVTDSVKSVFNTVGSGFDFDLPKLEFQLPDQHQMESDRPRFIKKEDENSNESGHSDAADGSGSSAAAAAAGTVALFDIEDDENSEISTPTRRPGGAQDDQFMLLTRKLIEVRNILMSIDHNEALRLPSIVVIGSQSSGKSSVLEAIVGHEFLPK
ncbi:7227_t:CDS:2 [Ambispora gerdemannii]|uniref:7227_t:CDS:1 n=1 Tax=Ambispora gerdemannii TaxID=144530 RepID=A0A9N9FWE3_9GLOM|nr:7227_t:CDS:2 [Ambispora gerdemannii]